MGRVAQPVDLDPRGYPGTYKLIGGSLALDFANLVSYRSSVREHDWLKPETNLDRWTAAVGLDLPAGADPVQLRELRELLARTFLAVAGERDPAKADVRALGRLAAAAWGQRRLEFRAGATAATWTDLAPTVLIAVAEDAAQLLTSPTAVDRISRCEECGWLFRDTSRNRSRHWCDPADCGNRARQRRHYRRRAR
jgi:predicted RNA-binding Zn ribbon-like protein